jgi:hypothetical protein
MQFILCIVFFYSFIFEEFSPIKRCTFGPHQQLFTWRVNANVPKPQKIEGVLKHNIFIRKKVSLNIISDKQVEFGTIQKMWYISSRDMCANANNIFWVKIGVPYHRHLRAYAILMY